MSDINLNNNIKLRNDLVRISVLEEEIQYCKSLLKPSATGHIHTTINFLTERVEQLKNA